MEIEALSSSLEDYLEAIYASINEVGSARAKDIAARLNVAAPSVTSALQLLKKRSLVNHAPYGRISLTSKGKKHAQAIIQRHNAFKSFFTKVLGIDTHLAELCACKMEHAVSDLVLKRFLEYLSFEENRKRGGTTWSPDNGFVCKSFSESDKKCIDCITALSPIH